MTLAAPKLEPVIRPIQYRDLEAVKQILVDQHDQTCVGSFYGHEQQLQQLQRWSSLLKLLRLFPHHLDQLRTYIWEQNHQLAGVVQVSPFNHSRSTWRVDQVSVTPAVGQQDVGTQLLRYCLENIWEARTWLTEIEVNQATALALYRHNGFQPLAKITYWSVAPEQLSELAEREPVLPNLLPVNNADAPLLYQLDTASMPPLVRQVFDRHIQDFKTSLITSFTSGLRLWGQAQELVRAYVFEPQRKAAIGYFEINLCRNATQPHEARLTVHPAYTWLYPELLTHMAQLTQVYPSAPLQLNSTDYQPEREEYLKQIGAEDLEQTLMMSRSVWHKLRESRSISFDTLQLSDMLQGLQPKRNPVPGRMTYWLTHPSPTYSVTDSHPGSSSGWSAPNPSSKRSSYRSQKF
ncbi:GNAT family N-acetyltransferase [Acaryochloris sp. IP29b_bin.148]|uniref:GNAT family N-acetyltransferase n=1 Tax=Acaryochloris sp. IP29b_bin.148 TaxID=2969218 RepID=UPI0026046DB1|nr:GNAT family N-acetyltransferase [Acaryochloris sp. IP29b_bin.148]